MKIVGVVTALSLALATPVSATQSQLHRLEGHVLERHGVEYVVLEGRAVPVHGTGAEPPGSLFVVLDPDPRAAPGPGTSYLGYGVRAGSIRGIASNGVALPAFRAADLLEARRTRP